MTTPKRIPRIPFPTHSLANGIRDNQIHSSNDPKSLIPGTQGTRAGSLEDLSKEIKHRLRRPTLLISRILSHFLKQDTMDKEEYEVLRAHFKTKFNAGNRGAVSSLQNRPHSWMSRQQIVYGSIVVEEGNCIRITPNSLMMYRLNTSHDTMVYPKTPLIEPEVIHGIMSPKEYVLDKEVYWYKDKDIPQGLIQIRDTVSSFLRKQGFSHNANIWYADLIRYKLDNSEPVDSGLVWHYENQNYPDLITVLCYLRKDESLEGGNLRYKDKEGTKKVIQVSTGTTVIMDGRVEHKPEAVSGTGQRDLIIISFQIH